MHLQFGALTPLEPRLGKKLIEPLTNLIHRQVYVNVSLSHKETKQQQQKLQLKQERTKNTILKSFVW